MDYCIRVVFDLITFLRIVFIIPSIFLFDSVEYAPVLKYAFLTNLNICAIATPLIYATPEWTQDWLFKAVFLLSS